MSTRPTETTGRTTPPEVLREVVDTVSVQMEELGTELGGQLQSLVQETNSRQLAIHDRNDRVLLRIPLTVGLVGGVSFLMLVPIRRALLLLVAALFAGIYISVEGNEQVTTTSRKARRKS